MPPQAPPKPTGSTPGATPPGNRKRTLIALGAAALGVVVVTAIGTAGEGDESTAASTSSTTTMRTPAPAATTTPAVRRTTTAAALPPPAPAPASSATEAGCDEPDPTIVAAIENSLTPGLDLIHVAAVSTMVDGIEYTYTAGDVFENGERHTSSVVWVSPGFGVMGLSSNSRDVSSLPFGRGILDVSAGDEYGSQVQNCVLAMARAR